MGTALTNTNANLTFKDLMQIGNSGGGLTGSLQAVCDGNGTASALQISTAAVNITAFTINGFAITLGGALTTAATFTTSGAFPLTLTTTASTNVTLPLTGTLATLAGTEALTNKTINGNTITAGTGVLTLAASKTLTLSNTVTLSGTDGSTIAYGVGGTVVYSGANTNLTSLTGLSGKLQAPTAVADSSSNNALGFVYNSTPTDYFSIANGTNNNSVLQVVSTQTNASASILAKGTGGIVIGSAGATAPLSIKAGTNTVAVSIPALTSGRTLTYPDQNIDLTPATKAQQQTSTQNTNFVTSAQQQSHPSSAKAWAFILNNGTASISTSYNVTGVVRNSTGNLTVTLTTAFTSSAYCVLGSPDNASAVIMVVTRLSASTVGILTYNTAFAAVDINCQIVCFGAQ